MSVPLSDTRLTEYRDLSFLDGAITQFDQTSAAVAATRVLVREVDRLRALVAEYQGEVVRYDADHERLSAELGRVRALVTRAQNAADSGDMVAVRAALADCCPRCNGSGIDPEHSSPGCTDPDRGVEPPNLEPCVACQYPPPEAELVDEPTCGVLNPKVAATCTEPSDHASPIHRDAFGNSWTRRDGERPLSIPTV